MKNIITSIIIIIILTSGCNSVQQPQTSLVKVKGGLVQGAVEDGLIVFKGIPFAAPPVGDLRWKAPQPAAKWEGVLEATKFAPAPIQNGNPPSGKSEDCLYLNVWTPAKFTNDRVPVLVWIYGGGFGAGSTAERNYSGENLAKKGVVLVSIAYRVGQLGFLAHPELSAENPNKVSGNYGLLDMIAGLQWIKENIASFGGDPKKVTIFGESAGGIAVSMLCASPLAKGLFHGAISQSGGSFGPPRPTTFPGENLKRLADAERDGEAYTKNAGVNSIKELRKISSDKLPSGRALGGMSWPIIDGYVIPDDQYKLYEAGKFNDTPILVGYNSDEGASFSPPRTSEAYIDGVKSRYGKFAETLIKAYPAGSGLQIQVDPDRMKAFGLTFSDILKISEISNETLGPISIDESNTKINIQNSGQINLRQLTVNTPNGPRVPLTDIATIEAGGGTPPKTARDLARDSAFGWQTWIWARLQSKMGKGKAYYYYFDQHPEYPADSPQADRGSPHGQDVGYVFQHLSGSRGQSVSESDQLISESMATYWTNFAKYGHPNGNAVPEWPAFSDANPEVMYFAQTPHIGPVPSAESLKALDAYFAWRRTPEGDAWAK